ncbi:PD-(D/E)XK nuclease family protein [Halapricum salinum]|uniref:PD-(D/E)XK nuclease family protein n=1 Tax=Halapricum salinum TaxID=1457250 RepID=UPI001F3DECFD|nr:PD-(D/E)XK nuclease family protein [Halapricum salinum]
MTVPIQRAKPVDALYEEISDYELVLVPDAPLASALNRHLDRPHLGDFATTPRRAAAGRREQVEERTVFLELLHETDLTWKQAAYLGEEIIHAWEYTGRPDGILDYDRFDTPAVRNAVEHVAGLETTSRRLTDYTVDESTELAVVGYPQFTALERSILPDSFDRIDRFADGTFDHPPFRVFDSATDIVAALRDTITAETADQVAVVLDASSEFSTLVESAFDSADIPFYGGPGFLDNPDHRAFLRLLRAAYRGRDVRVSVIRPILDHLGLDVDPDHDQKRLHTLDDPALTPIRDWCTAVAHGEHTFNSALTEYEALLDTEFEAFRAELETLDLAEQTITEDRVNDLEFYLQSYEVPITRENEGVLLADANAATHVDRPLVFYLGLDDDWTRTPLRRPWVDADIEFDRHLRKFQLLLQNGAQQEYLVRDTVGGDLVTPCFYFAELFEESFSRFDDADSERYTVARDTATESFTDDAVSVEPDTLSALSQSSLSTYVNSPRDYFFDQLVDSPDRDYFRRGNLFHDFAEFYVHHPDILSSSSTEEILDVMLEEMSPFIRDVDEDVYRTRFRGGLENLIAFLDEHAPDAGTLSLDATPSGNNTFSAYFDRPIGSDVTERWFKNEDIGIKGLIDLVQSSTRLVDYKSGSKKSASKIVTNSSLSEISDTPNFQALLYLTHQRSVTPDEQLEFVFVHFLENIDDVVRGTADPDETLTKVTYYPTTYEEFVQREAMFEQLREDGSNKCQKTLSQVEYADYRAVFEAEPIPKTRDNDELIESDFGDTFIERMQAVVGEYKYVKTGCKQAMRDLVGVRKENYFADDLDAFEAFIDDRLTELNERRAGAERFPIADLVDEPNYRRVNHRDLLLEDTQ